MSDSTQGEGWWQASDGKWYPPEQHPDFQAGATQPVESVPPTAAMPPVPPAPPPPGPPATGSSNAKWIIVGVLAVAAVAIAAFLLLGGDDKKQNLTASSSSASASSSSSSSKSSSSSSKSSSSSSSSAATAAELQRKMLTASDISPTFSDDTFTSDHTSPSPCGQPNAATQFPPVLDVGSSAANADGSLSFQEEVTTYKDASTAAQAFQFGKQGFTCTDGTANDGSAITLSAPKDASSSVGVPGAVEIDIQGSNYSAQLFAATKNNAIAVFLFQGSSTADTTGIPNPASLAKKGFQKLAL